MSDLKIEKDKWYKVSFYIKGLDSEDSISNDSMLEIVKFASKYMKGGDELKISSPSLTLEDQP